MWPDWSQFSILHNFCFTGAILMKSKYVIGHMLKFMCPHQHSQYVHPKAQKLKFLNFFRKTFFSSWIFQKSKVEKCAICVYVWVGDSRMSKLHQQRIFWAKMFFGNLEEEIWKFFKNIAKTHKSNFSWNYV